MYSIDDPRISLVNQLMPLLLAGADPRLASLRVQWESTSTTIESNTNWGFFAHFAVPQFLPLVQPSHFCGGDALIAVQGLRTPAGCILYIEDGALSYLEVYTYDEPWEPPPRFMSIRSVQPIIPGEHVRPSTI